MVVKMFKKILTRKKAPVSNRKYTKKNTKKKSKKGGGRPGRGRGRGGPGGGPGRGRGSSVPGSTRRQGNAAAAAEESPDPPNPDPPPPQQGDVMQGPLTAADTATREKKRADEAESNLDIVLNAKISEEDRQDKALQAVLTNLSKQNSDLTNKDGKTPERANMESNLKFNEPLPMLMKTFKKAKVNPGDKSEYFNLDNDSLKKLVNYWYGNKRGFFDKVLRGLGVTGPPVPVAEWDVSQVTNMSYLFTEAKDFNENISSWNVSNVQSMAYMFYESDRFSQNINDWDVGNVRNMRGMFQRSQKFNSYLDQWDTGRVLDMRDMFKDSRKFNRNIDTWNVSNVRNMERMFENTAYNKPLASWNVMSVVNMAGMFRNNVKFNQPLANWGSSLKSIKNLDLFLHNAKSFNQDLSDWNLSKIGVPESMLFGTTVRQEFYPIGQRVNTQSQNMGLTPSEEKRSREKQVNAQVKADLQRLKESQEQAKLSYDKQKMIHDEKLDKFKENLKQAEAQYQKEQKLRENATKEALAQEELELTRNRALLGDISGKPDDYKRSRSVAEARKDALSASRASYDYQTGPEKPDPTPADPKKPIKVPYENLSLIHI